MLLERHTSLIEGLYAMSGISRVSPTGSRTIPEQTEAERDLSPNSRENLASALRTPLPARTVRRDPAALLGRRHSMPVTATSHEAGGLGQLTRVVSGEALRRVARQQLESRAAAAGMVANEEVTNRPANRVVSHTDIAEAQAVMDAGNLRPLTTLREEGSISEMGHPFLTSERANATDSAEHGALSSIVGLGQRLQEKVFPFEEHSKLTSAYNLAPMIGLFPPEFGARLADSAMETKPLTEERAKAVSLMISSFGESLDRLPKKQQRDLVKVATSAEHFQNADAPMEEVARAIAGLGRGLSALPSDLQEVLTRKAKSIEDPGLRQVALTGLNDGAMRLSNQRTQELGLAPTPRVLGPDIQEFAAQPLDNKLAFANAVLGTKNETAISSVIGRLGESGMLDDVGSDLMSAITDAVSEMKDPNLQKMAARGVGIALARQADKIAAEIGCRDKVLQAI